MPGTPPRSKISLFPHSSYPSPYDHTNWQRSPGLYSIQITIFFTNCTLAKHPILLSEAKLLNLLIQLPLDHMNGVASRRVLSFPTLRSMLQRSQCMKAAELVYALRVLLRCAQIWCYMFLERLYRLQITCCLQPSREWFNLRLPQQWSKPLQRPLIPYYFSRYSCR